MQYMMICESYKRLGGGALPNPALMSAIAKMAGGKQTRRHGQRRRSSTQLPGHARPGIRRKDLNY